MNNEEKVVPTHKDRLESPDKSQRQKLEKEKSARLRSDLAIAFATPEGLNALKFLKALSGFEQNPVGGNPSLGMDVTQGTLYNCGRLSMYLELRKLLPPRILKQIEYDQLEEELL